MAGGAISGFSQVFPKTLLAMTHLELATVGNRHGSANHVERFKLFKSLDEIQRHLSARVIGGIRTAVGCDDDFSRTDAAWI